MPQGGRSVSAEAPHGDTWVPGDAPSQSLQWPVEAVAKAGSIGVYPPRMTSFPTGAAMNKNLTVKMGNCNHRRYVPHLLDSVRTGAIDPSTVLTQVDDIPSLINAYETFDRRQTGLRWRGPWRRSLASPQSDEPVTAQRGHGRNSLTAARPAAECALRQSPETPVTVGLQRPVGIGPPMGSVGWPTPESAHILVWHAWNRSALEVRRGRHGHVRAPAGGAGTDTTALSGTHRGRRTR
jgi:hypothetical protein